MNFSYWIKKKDDGTWYLAVFRSDVTDQPFFRVVSPNLDTCVEFVLGQSEFFNKKLN